jgi:formylglycine-generating enzyme required for sulfatase activity
VTVDQYKACVDDAGSCKNANPMALRGPVDRPVRFISWDEAVEYCKWLDSKLRSWSGTPGPLAAALSGARGGPAWKVRLPSEAEWEKAARGTKNQIYPWGDTLDASKATYGNRLKEPTTVGIYPEGASPYGLRDMSGNVWEWTRSRQLRYPYRPNNDREDTRPTKDARRVIRGGSFLTDDPWAARRNTGERNERTDFIGFRVAIGPPQ